ncbi:5-formyltetrahydrofolate cyclo-ligase [Periweissella ghanensis]|uniref:5-formyltetrahydrofolate cyclo-ligase n=1 Tax=Periweissella ghanensis TaxID=467997 RepID=A0ABM8ZCR4_9LACO|nr:5-formyltetrahydrofolate cyclo-ligase [Periweissella ghanensis]MCM0600377.1 5-formyltetrahydrofolate cyclo-ligase [Periweissella ghanensis]CAH0419311.1 putative protein YqgN [Periweissella ghanensis]
MDKTMIRQKSQTILQQLTPANKEHIMADNLRQLEQLAAWQDAQTIGITFSMPTELPTQMIIEAAWQAGKAVYLPKCLPAHQLAFLPYQRTDQLVKSTFGIWEPTGSKPLNIDNLDLLIVPGLRFATTGGMRVGFGGGFYDRLLVQFKGPTIALTTSKLVVTKPDWPIEPFDQAVDKILIGAEIYANNN